MKLLWVKNDFLHPTTRGGQIRTLEMLKRLHERHEIHYVAFDDSTQPEGRERSLEYCTCAYPVQHRIPSKASAAFAFDLVRGLVSSMPVVIRRYRSVAMFNLIAALLREHNFDSIVCDFLTPAPNIPDLSRCVLFQHNVESVIWKRHFEHAQNPVKRLYFQLQARRMHEFEGSVCRTVRKVIAVSDADADIMRSTFAVQNLAVVPTGVAIEYFQAPIAKEFETDLVFIGSMDWMPNIDGFQWFTRDVLPLIRERRPRCTVAVVGRKPAAEIQTIASADPRIHVSGTVPDIRPWLFRSAVSIVPLRIGGGTRLKIYEAMAAGVPVVSTTVGAEGLDVMPGENILIEDDPAAFAASCVALLENRVRRDAIARSGQQLVVSRYSWDAVARIFEELIAQ